MGSVIVILDANYGSRIEEISSGTAVWIIDSEINRLRAEAHWKEHHGRSHTDGITLFTGEVASPEQTLIGLLGTITLHHPGLSELHVFGCLLTPSLKAYLTGENFRDFAQTPQGFVTMSAPL